MTGRCPTNQLCRMQVTRISPTLSAFPPRVVCSRQCVRTRPVAPALLLLKLPPALPQHSSANDSRQHQGMIAACRKYAGSSELRRELHTDPKVPAVAPSPVPGGLVCVLRFGLCSAVRA